MKNSDKESILSALQVVSEGAKKLAEFGQKTAQAPEPDKEVEEHAMRVASKLAEFGYGSQSDVEANAAVLARSQTDTLSAVYEILEGVVAPARKEASTSQLGRPAAEAEKPKRSQRELVNPPRC